MTTDISSTVNATANESISVEKEKEKVIDSEELSSPSLLDNAEWELLTADGGVKKRILKAGHGSFPSPSSKVSVHYTGRLESTGAIFDSSRSRSELFSFTLGKGQVIRGWDIGVATMKPGETCELRIESEYGYGSAGSPPTIPPSSVLLFEVELFLFEDEPQTPKEMIAAALTAKNKGNEYFKHGEYSQALTQYEKAKEYVQSKWKASEEEATEMLNVEYAIDSNLASTYLKIKEYNKAKKSAQQAISSLKPTIEDADSSKKALAAKLYFKLGQALNALGEWDEAISALHQAQVLFGADRVDSAIMQEKALATKAKKLHLAKEKEMYKRMFA